MAADAAFCMERVLLLCATGAFVTWTCSEVLGSPPALRLATAPQSSGLPSTSTLSCPFSWGKTSPNLNLKRFDRERWRGGAAGEMEKVTNTEWDERKGVRKREREIERERAVLSHEITMQWPWKCLNKQCVRELEQAEERPALRNGDEREEAREGREGKERKRATENCWLGSEWWGMTELY